MNPNLFNLMEACHTGACNPIAIIHKLSLCINGMSQDEVRNSICVKYILGHINYLCGVGLAPDEDTMTAAINMIENDNSSN